MKRFVALLALITGLPLFADQEMTLPPGGSIDLSGIRVRCAGSDASTPFCRISSMGNDYYYVYVGTNNWGTVGGFDKAVKTVIELKQAGLCR